MGLFLPPLTFWLVYLSLRNDHRERREAILGASVFCGTSVVVITEILSIPRWLTREGTAAGWLFACIVAFFCWMASQGSEPTASGQEESAPDQKLDPAAKLLLGGAAVLAFFVALIAFIAPPSAWDAMSYHLPRVVMWMSNRSVRFFPTPDYSHLIFAPWAEYAMMHTYLLWGTDRFVTFVEFFSFLGCAVGVSWIAQMLGATPRGQAIAAFVCVAIPGGILEASGALNTYVVSYWIMATVAFLLRWNENPDWLNTTFVGLSAGIAILTKGHAFIYLPFLVLACWLAAPRPGKILFLKRSLILVLLILAVNGGQFLRSYQLTGSPIGLPFADAGPRLHWRMDRHDPRALLANVVRNSAIYLSVPLDSLNRKTNQMVRSAMEKSGVDPDDPLSIWPQDPFQVDHFSLHELHAVSPIHFALLLLSVAIAVALRRTLSPATIWYAAALLAGFLFFCFTLKWQNAQSRHHLPLFVLDSALVGLFAGRLLSRKGTALLGAVLFLYALPFALSNRTRSLIPWSKVDDVYHARPVLYFNDEHEGLFSSFTAAADFVNHSHCTKVAIEEYTDKPASEEIDEKSFYVYPIFPLIHADGRERTVWYTGVHSQSAQYESRSTHGPACAVICLDCVNHPEKWAEYRDAGGRASVFGYIVIFSGAGQLENTEAAARSFSASAANHASAPGASY